MEFDKDAWMKLFETGPLGTFSAKTHLARLLGLLSPNVYFDLTVIRKLRNEFAHDLATTSQEAMTFDTQSIRDRCMGLRTVEHEQSSLTGPRDSFVRTCAILNADLSHLVSFGGGQLVTRWETMGKGAVLHTNPQITGHKSKLGP